MKIFLFIVFPATLVTEAETCVFELAGFRLKEKVLLQKEALIRPTVKNKRPRALSVRTNILYLTKIQLQT